MGACVSKSGVMKNVDDAPLPAPETDEQLITAVDQPEVDADEAKRHSLGLLFKENEEEKGSSEEQVKQVDESEAKPQESGQVVETDNNDDVVLETQQVPQVQDKSQDTVSQESAVETTTQEKSEETSSDKVEEEEEEVEVEEVKEESKKGDEESEVEKTEEIKVEEEAGEKKKPLFKLWF